MSRRHRVYDRRIWKGALAAVLLTTALVAASTCAPEATGWLGFVSAPLFALGVMLNLAREGGLMSGTCGYRSRRAYFALLAACLMGWGAMALMVLTRL